MNYTYENCSATDILNIIIIDYSNRARFWSYYYQNDEFELEYSGHDDGFLVSL